MVKEILKEILIEEIHKKIANTPLHSLHSQMVSDVNKLKELGKDVNLCDALIQDITKPIVNKTELKWFYAGIFCILNVLLERDEQ